MRTASPRCASIVLRICTELKLASFPLLCMVVRFQRLEEARCIVD
jgi:hypothetical protein